MTTIKRETGSVDSEILGREMEFYWYGGSGRPVVLLPTSAGRHNENVDFGLVDAVEHLIVDGSIQVCSLDSINRDSWADDDLHPREKLRRHELYDRFLAEEFFPWLGDRTGEGSPVLYGASLGGWQSVTFAARHPESVGRVIAFSGFFDIRRLLDGWWEDRCYYYSPRDFVANMEDDWIARLNQVEWVVATGDGDTLAEQTRGFAELLATKGIRARAEIWEGCFGHDWPFWREHLPRFLP